MLVKPPSTMPRPLLTAQAPSTQRLLDDMTTQSGTMVIPAQVPQRTITPTEVVTSKGNGTSTRGPRKF
jgi:hypothetical protein